MKKLLSTLCAVLACANTAIAQVMVSRSELVGTKWQLDDDYYNHSSEYYEFTKKAFIWHRDDGKTSSYPFYLSNTIPTKFDSKKVGVSTQGRYYIKYNTKMDYLYCYAITYFDKSKGIMILKRETPEDVIGLTDTFTYINIDKKKK